MAAVVQELRAGAAAALERAKARLAAAEADVRAAQGALERARRERHAAATQVATEAVAVSEEDRREAERLVALSARRLAEREALAARFERADRAGRDRAAFALPVDGQVTRSGPGGLPVADPAAPFRPGETVATGPGGAARLLLLGGDVDVGLGERSAFRLVADAEDGLEAELERGVLRLRASLRRWSKKFEVRTPSAALAVRGTAYELEVREGREVLTVSEGVVAVRPVGGGEPVLVGAGERLTFGGAPPWPAPSRVAPAPAGQGVR